jgi:hypothetical protein
MILRTLCLSLLLAWPLEENRAAINGSVVDSNKKPISGAEIIITPGSHPTITTNKDGTFSLDTLEPGKYTIIILSHGYTPWARRSVLIEEGQKATFDVTLSPAIEDGFKIKHIEPRQKDLDSFNPALKSFGEPCFCDRTLLKDRVEGYRFLWLRTFHRPVLIQLAKNLGKATLTYKELDGKGGYEYGSIAENKSIDVYKQLGKGEQPDDVVQRGVEFLFERTKNEIWGQPFEYEETIGMDGAIVGLDGATWTVEAIKDGKCHVVTRWSPNGDDPVRRFAETLIDLSDKRFYYDEFY